MKLLKHEWLRTRSMILGFAGIAVLLVTVSALMAASGWPLISNFGQGVGVLAVVAFVPALQLGLVVDHYRTSFGRTGYFTQSIPRRGSTIYLAKLAWICIVTLVGIAVTLLFAAVAWIGTAIAHGEEINPVAALRTQWLSVSDITPTWVVLAGIAAVLVMYLSLPITYYFAVAVGSEKRFSRFDAGGPVLVYVALYVVNQLVLVAGILLLPFGIGVDGGSLAVVPANLISALMESAQPEVMPLGMLPGMLLVPAFCLWRTIRSWNHKVSLA